MIRNSNYIWNKLWSPKSCGNCISILLSYTNARWLRESCSLSNGWGNFSSCGKIVFWISEKNGPHCPHSHYVVIQLTFYIRSTSVASKYYLVKWQWFLTFSPSSLDFLLQVEQRVYRWLNFRRGGPHRDHVPPEQKLTALVPPEISRGYGGMEWKFPPIWIGNIRH